MEQRSSGRRWQRCEDAIVVVVAERRERERERESASKMQGKK